MGSNVTDTLVVGDVKKIGIGIFVYKQRLLSIQKFVKHVPRINERERERGPGSQLLSAVQTF